LASTLPFDFHAPKHGSILELRLIEKAVASYFHATEGGSLLQKCCQTCIKAIADVCGAKAYRPCEHRVTEGGDVCHSDVVEVGTVFKRAAVERNVPWETRIMESHAILEITVFQRDIPRDLLITDVDRLVNGRSNDAHDTRTNSLRLRIGSSARQQVL